MDAVRGADLIQRHKAGLTQTQQYGIKNTAIDIVKNVIMW